MPLNGCTAVCFRDIRTESTATYVCGLTAESTNNFQMFSETDARCTARIGYTDFLALMILLGFEYVTANRLVMVE